MNISKRALLLSLFAITLFTISCTEVKKEGVASDEKSVLSSRDTTQKIFWEELSKLYGKAYQGTVASAPANDTAFLGKSIVMHVRMCEENIIKIPLFVGEDSSRTWIFTLHSDGIQLKHDHRHSDGTPEDHTMYGGKTSNFGSAIRQIFPADQETADMLPGAITNVWWIDFIPGESFTYNIRRVNTDRLFSFKFDLSNEIEAPGKPWGWDL
jgi:hypothetical protein